MLKLLGIRSWIALMAVFVVAAGIYGMQDRLAGWWALGQAWWSAGKEERDWRQRELVFLKQLYDRLEHQRRAEGDTASASLRREQQAILQRMEQAAKPIRDKIPPEIRALLADPAPAEAEKAQPPVAAEPPKPPVVAEQPKPPVVAAQPQPPVVAEPPKPPVVAAQPQPPVAPTAPAAAAVPASAPVEFRIGTAVFPGLNMEFSALSRDPELDRLSERVNKLRARPAKPAEDATKPATADSGASAKQPSGSAKP